MMDDLNGLEWSATSNTTKVPIGTGNYYPSLRPTPPPQLSGRNTPLSAQGSGVPKPSPFAAPKSATPDSFSNLVSFGSSKQATLTLQEQQEKLQAEKRKQEAEKRKQYDAQFGGNQFWDGLGNGHGVASVATSRSGTPATMSLPSHFAQATSRPASGADEDLFAAFNKDTKVDSSSFYPPPSVPSSGKNTPGFGESKVTDLRQPQAWEQPGSLRGADFGDDDDPFGLSQMKAPGSAHAPISTAGDDDDFLGDLGKPVEEVRRRPSPAVQKHPEPDSGSESQDPWDTAVGELVDMGFSAEQSRRALTESGSGLDIQAAVGWILNDAHRQAKQKQQGGRDSSRNDRPSNGKPREPSRDTPRRDNNPAWMREEGRDSSSSRREEIRPASGDTDLSKTAAAVGNNLFKTANSLWKTSQKKVQKAVAEFQQESDPNQPKWMREAAEQEQIERRAATEGRSQRKPEVPEVTDEALMLEGGGRPARKQKAPEARVAASSSNSSRAQSPALPRPPPERAAASRWQQAAQPDPRLRVSKQAVEEQSAQAYISPARRKKTTPQPVSSQLEPDLFSSAPPVSKSAPPPRTTQRPPPAVSKPSTPIPTRPKAPQRQIPPLSPSALANSTQHRLTGTAHFKLGDYAAAHQSYSSSLTALPSSHPITIILLCNRALTGLKTGIPKAAIADANTAIELIGVSRGDAEVIDLGPGEGGGKKDMKEFYGKALMRKAEALESLEKWKEAGDVWKYCVEQGVGASNAIQGRTRCEKALAPKPAVSRTVTPKPAAKPKPRSALADFGPSTGDDSAAVKRLREANVAAAKEDDEKFALSEKVEARISNWRDGKRDNLRALIGSLDTVMWQDSGWKKVGMNDLLQNNKVKINYMKAIGKTHPDKLPQNANTEIRMIAGLVFATLNEGWDKFKQQNGM